MQDPLLSMQGSYPQGVYICLQITWGMLLKNTNSDSVDLDGTRDSAFFFFVPKPQIEPRFCISYKLPDAADAAGPWATL